MKNILFYLCLSAILIIQACSSDSEDETNQDPAIQNQTFTALETLEIGSSIGVITANDPEGEILTFTIASGNIDNTFGLESIQSLNGNSVVLVLASKLDYETIDSYTLGLEVSDGVNVSTGTVTVEVEDVVESATIEIGGVEYEFKSGVIEDYGAEDLFDLGFVHTNYDFTILDVDDVFTPVDDYAVIYSELFSSGLSFEAGTFSFFDLSNDLDGEDFFVYHTISIVQNEELIAGYVAVGGEISVTGETLDDYALSYNLLLQELDLVMEELKGDPFTFQFDFSDANGFDYFDESSRLSEAINLAKLNNKKTFE